VSVLLRRGVQATQVSQIVREAGVSRGTFYKHFDSKRQLVAAAARELLDRMLPRLPRAPALGTRADLEAALAAVHRHVLSAAAKERATARLLLVGGAASEPAAARILAAHEESWRRLVTTLLVRARAARLLRDGTDLALSASVVVGSVQHVLRTRILRAGGELDAEPDCEALATGLARLHTCALAT
jgi:AcrR family transcriptional regulator